MFYGPQLRADQGKNGQFVDHTMFLSHFIPHPNSYPVDLRDT